MKHQYLLVIIVFMGIVFSSGCLEENGHSCGGVPYDRSRDYCCGGTLHSLWEGTRCCNNEISYNETTQFCCNGGIYPSADQHCCHGSIVSGGGAWEECGSQCYQPETQSCCGGVVYNTADQACCDKKTVYSTRDQHCCNGTVEPGGGGYWIDCSGQCIDTEKQSCCYTGNYDAALVNGIVHEGAESCCAGRPQREDGWHCSPGDGLYYPPEKPDFSNCRWNIEGYWSC